MKEVWVIQSGDFPSDRMIWGVAPTVQSAAQFIRQKYGQPYIIKWDEPIRKDDDSWEMTGHFTGVPGFCGDGPETYDFSRYDVHN